jgi:hypothetical protein
MRFPSSKPLRDAARLAVAVVVSNILTASASNCFAAAPSLADLLTPDEFEKAGLKKLTPEELAFLSQRLLSSGVEPAAQADSGPATTTAGERAGSSPAARADRVASPYPPRGDDAFGQEQKLREQLEKSHGAPDVLTSRIVGSFRGWRGNTVFKFENGQVWQQIDGRRFVVDLEDPLVTVERGSFGAYYLSVDGYGSRTKVRRIE